MYRTLLVILILTGAGIACHPPKPVVTSKKAIIDTKELTGEWELSEINLPNVLIDSLYPAKKPSLLITTNSSQISGHTGCNTYTGTASIEGSQFKIQPPLALTKRYCPGQGEKLFLETLSKINRWAVIDVSTLALIADNEALMRFRKLK